MRRPFALFATAGVLVAAIAAVLGLWLPARQQHQDAAWTAAGERALAHIALPVSYSSNTFENSRIQVCSNGPSERCFLGPGDPQSQVATVEAALAGVTTGAVHTTCFSVPQPGSPRSCHLDVPVAGSRLAVELFAHSTNPGKPVSQWHYAGTYALFHVGPR